jgi:hypothetical protein
MSPVSACRRWFFRAPSVFLNSCRTSALALTFILVFFSSQLFAARSLTLSGSLGSARLGKAYSATLSVSGGAAPYQFSISAGQLPPGLSLNSSTGAISGTPTARGRFQFTVRVTHRPREGWGSKAFQLSVEGTGSGITVSVTPQTATVSSGASQAFVATVTGTANTAVTWSTTSGTISSSGVLTAPTVSTPTSLTVTASSVANNTIKATAAVSVSVSSSTTPTITTTGVPSATLGVAYASGIAASGGQLPYRWSISSGSLPPGIQFDSTTGALNGTPSQQGNFAFTAKVTDAASHSATQTLNLSVTSQPTGGTFDGPAELPRVYIQSSTANTPSPGTTINVPAGGNLQQAINAASCGDTLQLQAGATFSGIFTLPAKGCDNAHWITIRTSAPNSALPPEGTRMTPCYAGVSSLPARPALNCKSTQNVLAKLVIPAGGNGPIVFGPGANYYRLIGLELTRNVNTPVVYALVSLTKGMTADHLVFDRMWIHGTATDETTKGIQLGGSTYVAVVDSYINDMHCTAMTGSCTDSQAVGGGIGGNRMGPYKIVNNFLEAAGENILFGGWAATQTPQDIEVRYNHMFKPLTWLKGQPGFVSGKGGYPFLVKNLFELKNAQRVLFEGNILEYTWGGFSQVGFGILLTPKNQTNGTTNLCPLCQVTDVTIRYSTVSHVAAGMQIGNGLSGTGGAPLAGERYSIHDIIIDDINNVLFKGPGNLAQVSMGPVTVPVLRNVKMDHITAFPAHVLLNIGDLSPTKITNYYFTNSLVTAGQYPVTSTGGLTNCALPAKPLPVFNACFNGYSVAGNAIIATPSAYGPSTWPAGNYFPANAAAVNFVNYNNGNGGDYHLLPSSPYHNAATDGKDIGADVNAVMQATANVR